MLFSKRAIRPVRMVLFFYCPALIRSFVLRDIQGAFLVVMEIIKLRIVDSDGKGIVYVEAFASAERGRMRFCSHWLSENSINHAFLIIFSIFRNFIL